MMRYRIGARICRVIAAILMPALTGCQLLTGDFHADYRDPPEKLHEVMAVRLEEMSASPPVTVEEAASGAARQSGVVRQPPESLELKLAEVRAAALANNLELKLELVAPSIAQETVGEEQAAFEPLLFGSVEHGRVDRPGRVIDGPAQQSQATSYDAGVRIPLRTGGTVTVDLPINRFDDQTAPTGSSGDNSLLIDPSYETGLEFSISQPLLRGAGVRANTHAIRVARYEKEIADARTKLAAIRILAHADAAYWLLYATRRELAVRQEQYELALQQLDAARKRVEAGAAAEIEIARAESGVAGRLEAIIVADTEARRRERDLKRIMNRDDIPMDSATALIPASDPNPLGLELDAEALAELAVENRMELLELELQLAIDASAIDFEQNARLPLLTLDYSYRINGYSGSISEALRDLGGNDYADHTIGLWAEVPLGNQAAESRLRRARFQRLQRLATREQRRLVIRQEVFDAVDALEQDWQRILAARQEVIIVGRTYEGERRQFELGQRTSTDVLLAADRLADAQSREIRALAAYEISLVEIALATGNLIGRSGVVWEPATLE